MNPSYYAVIPSNIRYDKDLCAGAKLLYGEITALSHEKGYSWASNSYFAELYGVHKHTISRWISLMSDKKYIEVKQIENEKGSFDRRIYVLDTPPTQNCVPPPTQKDEGVYAEMSSPLRENEYPPLRNFAYHNNTEVNNTINNKIEEEEEIKEVAADAAPVVDVVIEEEIKVLPLWVEEKKAPQTGAAKKTSKPKPPPDPLFKDYISCYSDFFKQRNRVAPKLSGQDFGAMKQIQIYLISITESKSSEDGLLLLKQIFSKWDQIEPFYRSKFKLIEINSNLNNIIAQVVNGNPKTNGYGHSAKQTPTGADFDEAFAFLGYK
jgi:hypothetical protein